MKFSLDVGRGIFLLPPKRFALPPRKPIPAGNLPQIFTLHFLIFPLAFPDASHHTSSGKLHTSTPPALSRHSQSSPATIRPAQIARFLILRGI